MLTAKSQGQLATKKNCPGNSRSGSSGNRNGHRIYADNGPQLPLRHRKAQVHCRQRHDRAGAQPLDKSGCDEHGQISRKGTGGRSQREDRYTNQEDPARTMNFPKRTAWQKCDEDGKLIARHHPDRIAGICSKRHCNRWQGHIGNRAVQNDKHKRHEQHGNGHIALRRRQTVMMKVGGRYRGHGDHSVCWLGPLISVTHELHQTQHWKQTIASHASHR